MLAVPGLVAVAACVYLLDGTDYPGWIVIIPTTATAAVLAAGALGTGPAQSLLALAPIRAIGRISFSVYLWHWPVVLFLDGRWPDLDGPLRLAILIAVTLALSALAYWLIEQPLMRLRDREWEPLRNRLGRVSHIEGEARGSIGM